MSDMTLEQIKKEVHKLDPKCEVNSHAYKAAVCLLASLQVGPNAKKVAEFTGYHLTTVRDFAGNLRDSGVWKKGKIHCEWFDKKSGSTAFWLDVAVAQGLVQRA